MAGMGAGTMEIRLHAETLADAPRVIFESGPVPRVIRIHDEQFPDLVAVYVRWTQDSGVAEFIFDHFE